MKAIRLRNHSYHSTSDEIIRWGVICKNESVIGGKILRLENHCVYTMYIVLLLLLSLLKM